MVLIMKYLNTFLIILFFFNYSFCLNPEKEYIQRPENFNLGYKELKIEVSSEISLNLWDYDNNRKASDMTIILVGGDAGNMGYLLDDASKLISLGFHVISFDYRGFGASSDFRIEKSQLYYDEFSNDLSSVIQYARKNYPTHKIGLFAFSMGTIISFLTYQNENFDFFVGDGVIYNPTDVVKRIKDNFNKIYSLPANTKFKTEFINKINIPMLFYVGKKDNITTVDDCKNIVSVNKGKRQLIVYEGGHLSGYKSLKEEYYKNIQVFLNKL